MLGFEKYKCSILYIGYVNLETVYFGYKRFVCTVSKYPNDQLLQFENEITGGLVQRRASEDQSRVATLECELAAMTVLVEEADSAASQQARLLSQQQEQIRACQTEITELQASLSSLQDQRSTEGLVHKALRVRISASFFKIEFNYSLHTLIQKFISLDNENTYFLGYLTGVSAKKEPLVRIQRFCIQVCVPYDQHSCWGASFLAFGSFAGG